jgi:hypothetical protein
MITRHTHLMLNNRTNLKVDGHIYNIIYYFMPMSLNSSTFVSIDINYSDFVC